MIEIWKDIRGYEGLYQVSNVGNVKSLNYKGVHGNEKNLKFKKNCNGYLWVILYGNGKSKPMLVHRLVAEAFIDNPHAFPIINHKDENKLNNTSDNLEWCTTSYNVKYSIDRHPERAKGVANARMKKPHPHCGHRMSMKIDQYDLDGNYIRTWENSVTIMKETGMSDWSISECCRGNRKKAYGFKWQYAI